MGKREKGQADRENIEDVGSAVVIYAKHLVKQD